MHCGYITQIKDLIKHPNADKLQCGSVFGNSVIVGMEYTNNQIGVYFPIDLKLGIEYATENNLLRKKDANGIEVGGFLDNEKRNITAIRLRGLKSDGLFMPLKSLEKFTDISKLKEGDTINILNGVVICEKYIPNGKRTKQGTPISVGNKQKMKTTYPLFEQHIDTSQLAYNQNAFKVGDTIYITLKMHGCFIIGTKIRMSDGVFKNIQDIKVGDSVMGYNLKTKLIEPTSVLQIFHNDKSDNWRKIKFSRTGLIGDKRGYTTCTPNHPFWVEKENKYIESKDLCVGMEVSTLFPSKILTQIQKDIMVGSFLGDGCLLSFNNKVAEIQTSSKKEHEEYQNYLISICNGLLYKNRMDYISGYGTTMIRSKSYRTADLYKYFEDICTFNNKGTNKLLKGLVDKFTPLSMAIFYLDDGSLAHSEKQKDRAIFSICDYGDSDAEIICNCFRKFDIEPILYKGFKGLNNIRLNTKDAYKMFSLIYKFIPGIMRYKLPEEFRDLPFEELVDTERMYEGYILSPQKVLENIPVKKVYKEYDLETELHNYIAGSAIVHNTSHRMSNTIKTSLKRQSFIQRLFKIKNKTTKEWEVVSGTRRVILKDLDGSESSDRAFRKKHHDIIKTKLNKGESIFFEIVGWESKDTTIMNTCDNKKLNDKEFLKKYGNTTIFSYGCDIGQNDVFVYRMTMTNEDGFIVEYPTEFVKIRCEQMGLKFVPILDKFIFTTIEDLMARVEFFIEGEDPIGKTHIKEGVVVRIDNSEKFKALKHKNFEFKCLEGIIKNDATEPDMEEVEDSYIEEE